MKELFEKLYLAEKESSVDRIIDEHADIFNILRETVGVPEYYEWRSRSGCFFCFFQRRDE